jgi:hypothetical protein
MENTLLNDRTKLIHLPRRVEIGMWCHYFLHSLYVTCLLNDWNSHSFMLKFLAVMTTMMFGSSLEHGCVAGSAKAFRCDLHNVFVTLMSPTDEASNGTFGRWIGGTSWIREYNRVNNWKIWFAYGIHICWTIQQLPMRGNRSFRRCGWEWMMIWKCMKSANICSSSGEKIRRDCLISYSWEFILGFSRQLTQSRRVDAGNLVCLAISAVVMFFISTISNSFRTLRTGNFR